MNLHLKYDGQSYHLYQTPTYITYMIMASDKGEVVSESTKKTVKGILQRYIQYLHYLRQNDNLSLDGDNNFTTAIKKLESLNPKKMYFYIL